MEKVTTENKREGYKYEKGEDVTILLKFIRHGERSKDGHLEDHGREITRERAKESGLKSEDFDAIKAYGSNAGPVDEKTGMGRSLETADIFAHEVSKSALKARVNDTISYTTLVTPSPHNHVEVYNSFLPDNFEDLEPEDKIRAAKKAQQGVVEHLFSLDTPEAKTYREEVAGSFAYVIEHYKKMANKLKSGSNVLLPQGTHGGTMELLLQQALIRSNKEGERVVGFDSLDDIEGEFSPSDSYNIEIHSKNPGEIDTIKVTFDNPDRPQQVFSLDDSKVRDLAEKYAKLHQKNI